MGPIENAVFAAPDIAFYSGVVVANQQGNVLLLEDLNTGRIELPRSRVAFDGDGMFAFPGQYLQETTGLTVERLPLHKPARRYKNANVDDWNLLRAELHFAAGSKMTTSPFSVGLDLICIPDPDVPDIRQAMTAWYAGIVRDAPNGDRTRNGLRLRFVPIQDAIYTVREPFCDFAGASALQLFEVLWRASTVPVRSRKA